MLENATRLCEAKFGTLFLCEGDGLRIRASLNVGASTRLEVRSDGARICEGSAIKRW